ncbi:hypothetical protein ACLXBB_37140, partial [Pseudomonas aeruginosa]
RSSRPGRLRRPAQPICRAGDRHRRTGDHPASGPELAAASRPVKDSEVRALAGFGDLRSPYAEQVTAIDGLAIILHPD